MSQSLLPWATNLININLSAKLSQSQLEGLKKIDQKYCDKIVEEIGRFIDQYNSVTDLEPIYINTIHLKSIRSQSLPPYVQIIDQLLYDQNSLDVVIKEIKESPYFYDIYQVNNSSHFFTNFMILLYRNSLLNQEPQLRVQEAQISSTIEEMACKSYLEGQGSLLFQAIKGWIIEWEREGFSEELAKLVMAPSTISPSHTE